MNDGLFDDDPVTLDEQIRCVEREIVMREHVYPRLVAQGKMTKTKSTYEMGAIKAVLQTLLNLKGEEP